MADSPIKNIKGALTVIVSFDGTELPKANFVRSIDIIKEINKIPSATIVIQDGEPSKQIFAESEKAMFKPGAAVEVKVGYGTGNVKSVFKGVVVELGARLSTLNGSSLVLKCKDKALKMTLGRKNKMYFDKKDSEIISEIVGEDGLSVDVTASAAKHKKIVQHACTNWDFVLARADINGYVTIVEDGKLSIKKPAFDPSNVLVSYGNDMVEMNLTVDSTHQLTESVAKSWNHTTGKLDEGKGSKPTVNKQGDLDSAALSSVTSPKDLMQTNADVSAEALKPWADAVWQRRALSRIRGTVTFYGADAAVVGKTIELFGQGKRFTGQGYISKVRHTVKDAQWLTEVELGLPAEMYLETNRDAQPLPAGGMLPGIYGLQIGIVKQIHEDPDGEVRVLVNIPIIDKMEGKGIWVRKSHYYATKNAGFVFYPEVDDEVVIGFLDADPAHGIILGSLYSSSKHVLASAHTPDNKNTYKAISTTEGKLRIEIEDVKKIITIITPKKHKLVFDDDKDSITLEDPVNKNKMVFDSKGILIQAQADITVKTQANFILEAMQDIKTKSTANTKMQATANFEIKATAQMKAEGVAGIELKSAAMAKLEGAAMTQVKGGVVMIN
jgi:Rhs element Vgr protein